MTTICFRDNIMAADTRGYAGRTMPIGAKSKIFKFPDGRLLGISSVKPGTTERVVDWFKAGKPMNDMPHLGEPNFSGIEVLLDGTWLYYLNSLYPSGPLHGEFVATGSGEEFALGAMDMGADALHAVQIAAKFDPWTAGPFETLQLGDPTRWELMK